MKISDYVESQIKGLWGTDFDENGIPVIKTNNLTYEGNIDYSEICKRNITKEQAKGCYLRPGDLLIEKSGGTKTHSVGYVSYFEGDENKFVCNNFILALRPKNTINSKFLFYQIQFKYESNQFSDCFNKTTGIQNLKVKDYLAKEIKIYSPEEQEKIVKELDTVRSTSNKNKQILEKYDTLIKSRFIEMFGDISTGNYKFETRKLGSVSEVGSSHRVFTTEFVEQGVPFYRGTEIGMLANGQQPEEPFHISEEHYNRLTEHDSKPKIGDLLMPSICNKGQVWMVDTDTPFYYKDGRVLSISPNQKIYNSKYLQYFMREKTIVEYPKLGSGSTFAEFKIFLLKDIDVLTPPISLQNDFAAFVQQIDKSKFAVQKSLEKAETLYKSLMQEYFG